MHIQRRNSTQFHHFNSVDHLEDAHALVVDLVRAVDLLHQVADAVDDLVHALVLVTVEKATKRRLSRVRLVDP
jgi:hypothetical protein